jgi:hypothetical protein
MPEVEPPQSPPPFDPTQNVLNLVQAAMQRQDDLRDLESRNVRELLDLRAVYDERLDRAESARIDAIRAVDVGAVQRAAEVQAAQQQALAAQVATTADAFRASLAAALSPIQASIEDLRRAQYETQGQKQQVVETRSDTRLNLGAAVGVSALLLTILSLVLLYATKK